MTVLNRLYFLILWIFASTLYLHDTNAVETVTKAKDCLACLADTSTYKAVCNSNSLRLSYCCTQTDFDRGMKTCNRSELCSNNITDADFTSLVCPHEKYRCGVLNPNIRLNLGDEMTIKLGNKFGPNDACWYKLTTRDRVPTINDIPRYNRKHMQVYFSKMSNI